MEEKSHVDHYVVDRLQRPRGQLCLNLKMRTSWPLKQSQTYVMVTLNLSRYSSFFAHCVSRRRYMDPTSCY